MLLQTFEVDLILIIKFDTSNVSFTHLIQQTSSKLSGTGQRQHFKAMVKSDFSVLEMMPSLKRVCVHLTNVITVHFSSYIFSAYSQ